MSRSGYIQYYSRQAGYGISDIGPIYTRTRRTQKGSGLGNIFSSIYRFVKPFLTSLVPALKSSAISASTGIINDIGSKPFNQILKDNTNNAVKTFISSARQKQTGGGCSVKKNGKKGIKSKSSQKKVQSHIRRRKGSEDKKKKKTIKKRVLDIFSR